MLREIFLPNKRSLLIWATVLFVSSPILVGIWQRDVVTSDVSWPLWRNVTMSLFMSLNWLGSFLQAPFFLVNKLLPSIPNNLLLENIISFIGIALNSYLIASLLGVLWHAYKKRAFSKRVLSLYISIWILYIVGAFIGYFIDLYFVVFIVAVVAAIAVTMHFRRYSQNIFIAICLLTALFSIGALGQTLEAFEENYCWDIGQKADSTGSKIGGGVSVAFQTHMDCHKTFNLMTALREKYFSSK